MSILAVITVYSCDHCARVATVQTEDQQAEFESAWFCGWRKCFCPECRGRVSVQAAIDREEEHDRVLNRMLAKYSRRHRPTPEEVEYAH